MSAIACADHYPSAVSSLLQLLARLMAPLRRFYWVDLVLKVSQPFIISMVLRYVSLQVIARFSR